MKYMMKCGHAANAVDKNGNPCCAIWNLTAITRLSRTVLLQNCKRALKAVMCRNEERHART